VSGERLRVLYLTHHLPWPAHSGGRLREAQLLSRLSAAFDIHVVAMSKNIEVDQGGLPEAACLGLEAKLFPVVPAARLAGPLARRHDSARARRYLEGQLSSGRYDVIHVEGHYLMPLLSPSARRRAVLVEHNVESHLFCQAARAARRLREQVIARHHASLTRIDERRAWHTARLVGAVSAEDARVIGSVVPSRKVRLVPNGADHLRPRSSAPASGTDQAALLFVANFGYPPSEDAARLLLEEVLPGVRESVPEVSLAMVGADPPVWLRAAATADPRVEVTGRVPDILPWLLAATVFVAPMRLGGGVKVKILEALAVGKAVVTTRVGVQGLHGLPPGSLVEAADTGQFVSAVVHLLTSAPARRHQEARALAAAASLPTWDQAADRLAACWRVS
jgi:glycosyltransferase involved in cell wall biosynthesis